MAMAPPPLVHGTIEATIRRTSPYTFADPNVGMRFIFGYTRLHVAVSLDQAPPIARTADVVQNPAGTEWNETIHGHCAHHAQEVIFSITICDSKDVVGHAHLHVTQLKQETADIWLPVRVGDASYGQEELGENAPKIRLQVKFHDPAALALASEVPRTYFGQRPGSRVTLYQDAHCLEPRVVELPAGGGRYQRERCWEDVFDAIDNAKHLVYIAGWSVNTSTKLVRRRRDGKEEAEAEKEQETTLGDLLKRKAEEKVRVLLLVWNDMASIPLPLPFISKNYIDLTQLGCQSTRDKETKAYFKKTGVHCVIVYRRRKAIWNLELPDPRNTHHQKMIIVDHAMPGAPADSDPRQIVSFVGGLDLCDGRYDTQDHCLFSTLDKDDFHQVSIQGASFDKGGPRTPWHDIHSRIEGPAAWDVLETFEQRWRKQAGDRKKKLLVNVRDNKQIKSVVNPDNKEAWKVQVFRSIDSTSVVDFPSVARKRLASGLVCGHGDRVIERSVQDAYIHAIRRANNFIYIESQYLIGGGFQWECERDGAGRQGAAQNLVPRELSLKIASKIKDKQPFAVYVVLPMWPEGIPNEWQVQQILYYQRLTMEMMYRDVAEALKDAGKDVKPEEYLLFFCLGNREPNKSNGELAGAAPDGTPYANAQEARRFMIYVHSKMMIVDDDYIMVGSANINQRSMDGTWDTEIAMGACQPQADAKGQVRGFRMSLWYEHLGCSKDDHAVHHLLKPGEPSCVQQVKMWAEANWESYAEKTETPRALPHGHLLPYPIQFDSEKGSVTYRAGVEYFPDTEAPVLGARGESIPAMWSDSEGLC